MPAAAQWKDWDYQLDQEKKPWSELQQQLPPYPKPENLIKFDIGTNSANQFFIDAPSLSVGDDGVVRYTLMVKAGGGATNVSFEGLRCETRQVRVYAFGHPGNQWSRARDQEWREVRPREINGYHQALLRDYFCTQTVYSKPAPYKLQDILGTLKRGPARAQYYSVP